MSSLKMEKETSSESNISADSLEDAFKRKTSLKDGMSEDNIDTILVPFYEKDVLVKVPKEQKKKKELNRQGRSNDRLKESQNSSYLVNKDARRARRTTYLEMFRKQLSPQQKVEPKPDDSEIRSLSPEVGDTARESISGDHHNPVTEFYNTESYNEIYYEKLLHPDLENYMDSSYEEGFNKESDGKSPRAIAIENLKSVSEVSQANRHARRATVQPIQTVKLGGLGPDMEQIKPRLERARSLQRYSEKVRMENRLRIYKKSVQVENDKIDRESSTNQRSSKHEITLQKDTNASYLVNKSSQQISSHRLNKLYTTSKSADVKMSRIRTEETYAPRDKSTNRTNKKVEALNSAKGKRIDEKKMPETRAKSSTRNKGINTDGKANAEVPPVHINFMVNVGGVRPSSALRNLEEKHRMYQEQVKAFKMENKD